MRLDKLRRRLVVGLLVVAGGVGFGASQTTAAPAEWDWGSTAPSISADTVSSDTASDERAFQLESFEWDWG